MTRASPPHGDLSSLFNFLPIGAYRCSPDGIMLRANTALVALNGYASEEALLDSVRVSGNEWYVLPGRRAEFRHLLERDGYVRGFVSEIRPKGSDRHIWVSENAHVVRAADGAVLYYEGTFEDITAQVLAQQAQRSSEEQLRLLTAQIPGMVYMVDLDREGRRCYRFVSEGVREIYGFGPQELMRDPMLIARYRHPDDAARLAQETVDVLNEGVDLAGEYRVVWPDGRLRWVYQRSCEVARSFDRVTRVGVLLDVTERVQAQQALHASEALWKVALESAGDGVWDWNLVTGEGYLSPGILAMYGFAERDQAHLAGELDRRTHPDDMQQMLADRQAHFEGRVPVYRNEHRIRCTDGSWKWVLSRGMVIARDHEGRPLRMVGTHTDITELKQTEARRQVLEVQLRESQKMEAIGTLAGGVAHDFNNLLAAILGNLGLALEATTAPAPRQLLEEAERSALRARALTRQLLTFSRGGQPVKAPISIARVLAEAAQMGRLGTAVGCDLAVPGDLWHVEADEGQLAQVFNNLVVNAVQAMPAGGTVTLRAANVEIDEGHPVLAPGRHVRVEVTDTGVGIPQDLWTKVFDPYFTTKPTGSGLGLAVAYAVVKHHEGAIDLASTPGHGTTFTVHLPACAAAEEAPCATRRPVTALGGRVLVMDDEAAVRRVAVRALETFGCEVEEAADGAAAIGAYARAADEGRPFDLVLVDLTIPGGMGGEDAVARMREIDPGVVAIVSSGYSGDAILSDYAAHGFSGVLPKPYRVDALRAVVADALEARAGRPACHVPPR